MWTLLQDLRFALRQFRKSPGFVITAILSLMLGIGATTAMFSVVYGILLDPYPYKDNNRMVHVQLNDKNDRGPLLLVNGSGYKDLRNIPSLDDVFLQRENQENLTGDQIPVSVNVGLYSPNLFEYMGVPPVLGREFTPADAPGGNAPPLAVLSYIFWQRQFGGSRDVLGKNIELDHKLYTIIGVVPPRFTWGDSDVYTPAFPTADPNELWLAFVKLKPGAKFPVAQAQFQALVDQYAKQSKNYPQDRKVKIVTLNEQVLGQFAGTLTAVRRRACPVAHWLRQCFHPAAGAGNRAAARVRGARFCWRGTQSPNSPVADRIGNPVRNRGSGRRSRCLQRCRGIVRVPSLLLLSA